MDYDDDKLWEESSIHSNVSANTDIKVFKGGIRNNQTNNSKKSFDSPIISDDEVSFKESKFHNKKHKMSNNNNNNNKSKKHKKHNNAYNVNINLNTLSNKELNNKKSLIASSYPPEGDILSFRSDAVISIKQNIKNENNNNDSLSNNEKKEKLLSKFKDFTKEDDEIINGYYYERKDIINNTTNKRKHNKCMYKTFTHIKFRFKVASIEKGVALLVSEDDCIFILPTILLPKTTKVGNTYKLSIEETNLNLVFKNQISAIQKTFINQYNE